MIFCFVRETKQLTLEELDRKSTSFDSFLLLVWQQSFDPNSCHQRSSPSRLASSSAMSSRLRSLTFSSDTSSARIFPSPLRSWRRPATPPSQALPRCRGTVDLDIICVVCCGIYLARMYRRSRDCLVGWFGLAAIHSLHPRSSTPGFVFYQGLLFSFGRLALL